MDLLERCVEMVTTRTKMTHCDKHDLFYMVAISYQLHLLHFLEFGLQVSLAACNDLRVLIYRYNDLVTTTGYAFCQSHLFHFLSHQSE